MIAPSRQASSYPWRDSELNTKRAKDLHQFLHIFKGQQWVFRVVVQV